MTGGHDTLQGPDFTVLERGGSEEAVSMACPSRRVMGQGPAQGRRGISFGEEIKTLEGKGVSASYEAGNKQG